MNIDWNELIDIEVCFTEHLAGKIDSFEIVGKPFNHKESHNWNTDQTVSQNVESTEFSWRVIQLSEV